MLVAEVAIVVVVDTGSSATGFDGVLGIMVGPEAVLDRRSPGSGSVPVAPMPRGGGVLAVH
jgi:hypothetical protein